VQQRLIRFAGNTPRALLLAAVLAFPLAAWGCGGTASPGQASLPPGGPLPSEAQGGPGGGDVNLKQIMGKIGRGPTALSAMLNRELNADPPAWETIQPQTAEYAKLAADLGKSDPPRGSKDSWAKLSAAFAASAAEVDRVAQARDVTATRAAQAKLGSSCMECHREHRGGPGGPGGFGPPPQPGQVLAPSVREALKLTPEQQQQVDALQKEVDGEIDKILTDEQKKQMKEPPRGFGPGGPDQTP
jgi:hypothetical protein